MPVSDALLSHHGVVVVVTTVTSPLAPVTVVVATMVSSSSHSYSVSGNVVTYDVVTRYVVPLPYTLVDVCTLTSVVVIT